MKAVQVGILVMLVVVAGLLYVNYRGQKSQPVLAPATTETTQPPAPAAQPTSPAAEAPSAPAPAASRAQPAKPAGRPSPAPRGAARPASTQSGEPAQGAAHPPTTQPVGTTPATESAQPQAARVPLTPPSGTQPSPPPAPRKVTIPAGTLLSVRLTDTISSEKNQAGDSFTAALDQPLIVEGFILAERGARVEGKVLEVQRSGRVSGLASLKIHLVKLHTSDGQQVEIRTEPFAKTAEATRGEDAKKIGIGAAIGAAVGAIAGGRKGAAIGAGVGGAAGTGTVVATRGKPAVLASETRLSFRLQEPVTVVEKLK